MSLNLFRCVIKIIKIKVNINKLCYLCFRREDDLDVEVSASGFTRQMDKDLCIEMGIEKDDDSDNESEEVARELEARTESSEVEELRKEVEDVLNEFHCEVSNNGVPGINGNSVSDTDRLSKATAATQSDSVNSETLQDEEMCETKQHLASRIRFYSHTCSVHSTSTAATIAPEEIRSRVKKSLERREKAAQKKRITVKGEASAVTRSRRENMDTIKQCDGIWSWE
jgi:RIO kinase 2